VFLPAVQVLGFLKIFEVPMVIQDLYYVLSSLQDVPPFLQALDDYQEFLVVDFIVHFGSGEALGHEPYQMLLVILAQLGQDGPYDISKCVCFQLNLSVLVRLHKDGGQCDELLKFLKGLLLIFSPSPHLSLLGELV